MLITRFSAVGDIAMTLPVLYPLAEKYPNHRFVFVSRPRFKQFFINCPKNLEFREADPNNYKGLRGLYRLYKELKAEYAPDAFADLHNVLRTKILRLFFTLFNNTTTAHIEKGRAEKRRLVKNGSIDGKQLKSTFERYCDVFSSLGLQVESDFVSLFGEKKGNIDDLASYLPPKGNDRWVGIAPFAKHKGKIYPVELMRCVIERLSQERDIKIICFGNGKAEEEIVEKWCRDFNNVISFVGKSNFNGELRLISNLNLMISMDSANMHLASLVNTRVLSIWGATSPLAGFLGWRQKMEDCIELPLKCRPCSVFGNKPCRTNDYRCLNIPPERIVKKILEAV